MDGRSKRAGRRVAGAVIAGTAIVTLGVGVHNEAQVIEMFAQPQAMSKQTNDIRQEECLFRAIRSQVPEGAHVYVSGEDWHYMQRLAELSTPWAVPEANPASARYKLAMIPARGHCYGFALKVSRI